MVTVSSTSTPPAKSAGASPAVPLVDGVDRARLESAVAHTLASIAQGANGRDHSGRASDFVQYLNIVAGAEDVSTVRVAVGAAIECIIAAVGHPNGLRNPSLGAQLVLENLADSAVAIGGPVAGAWAVQSAHAIQHLGATASPLGDAVCRHLAHLIVLHAHRIPRGDLRTVLRCLLVILLGAPADSAASLASAAAVGAFFSGESTVQRLLHPFVVAEEVDAVCAGSEARGGPPVPPVLDALRARLAPWTSLTDAFARRHVCRAVPVAGEDSETAYFWSHALFHGSPGREATPAWQSARLRDVLCQSQLSQFDWLFAALNRSLKGGQGGDVGPSAPLGRIPPSASLRALVTSVVLDHAQAVAERVGDLGRAGEALGGDARLNWYRRFREWNALADLVLCLTSRSALDFEALMQGLVRRLSSRPGGLLLAAWLLLPCTELPPVGDRTLGMVQAALAGRTGLSCASAQPTTSALSALMSIFVGAFPTPLPAPGDPAWFFRVAPFSDIVRAFTTSLESLTLAHPRLTGPFTLYQDAVKNQARAVVESLASRDPAQPLADADWHAMGAMCHSSTSAVVNVLFGRLTAGIESRESVTASENGAVVAYFPQGGPQGPLAHGIDVRRLDQLSGRCRMRLASRYYDAFIKLCRGEGLAGALSAPLVETFVRLYESLPAPFTDNAGWPPSLHRVVPMLQEALSPDNMRRSPLPAHVLAEMVSFRLVRCIRNSPGLSHVVALLADGSRRAASVALAHDLLSAAVKLASDSFSGEVAAFRAPAAEGLVGRFSNELLVRAVVRALAASIRRSGLFSTPMFGPEDVVAFLQRVEDAWGHHLRWSEAAASQFPEPMRSFYAARAAAHRDAYEASKIKAADVQALASVDALFEGADAALVESFVAQFSEPDAHRLLLPAVYRAVYRLQTDTTRRLNASAVRRAVDGMGAGAFLSAIPALVDFVVDQTDAQHRDAADIASQVQSLDDLCFAYGLVPLDLVMAALLRGVYEGGALSRAMDIVKLLLNPGKSNVHSCRRVSEFIHLRVSPEPLCGPLPDDASGQGARPPPAPWTSALFALRTRQVATMRGGAANSPPPSLVYFGDYALRLLPSLDAFVSLCLEHFAERPTDRAGAVHAVADLYGALYRYHDIPVTLVHSTLSYYPLLDDKVELMAVLARTALATLLVRDAVPPAHVNKEFGVADVEPWNTGAHWLLTPEFLAYVSSVRANSPNAAQLFEFASQPAYLASFVLRLARRLCDLWTGEHSDVVADDTRQRLQPDWRFSEFSCPRSRLLLVASCEMLAAPVGLPTLCTRLVTMALDGIPADVLAAAEASLLQQRDARAPGHYATPRLPDNPAGPRDVLHAVGALLSRLPADVVGPILVGILQRALACVCDDTAADWLRPSCTCDEGTPACGTRAISVVEPWTSRLVALLHVYAAYGGIGAVGVIVEAVQAAAPTFTSLSASFVCALLAPFSRVVRSRSTPLWEKIVHLLAGMLASARRPAVDTTNDKKRKWGAAFGGGTQAVRAAETAVAAYAHGLVDGVPIPPHLSAVVAELSAAMDGGPCVP